MTKLPRPQPVGRRRTLAGLLAAALAAVLLGLAPGALAAPVLVSATPDPTAGANGRVEAITRIGGWLYVGGSFTAVSGQARAGLARLDVASGAVDRGWQADVAGTVRALAASTDGSTLFVGGEFSAVGGQARENLAAVSTATGGVTAWNPGANRAVQALAASSNRVYVGGKFARIGGVTRARLAAVNAATGVVDQGFAPSPDQWVAALRLASGQLYAAGFFTTIGGTTQRYLAVLDAATGAASPTWRPSLSCPVYALDLAPQAPTGSTIYAACGGSGGSALAFSTSSASTTPLWLVRTNGNLHGVAYLDGAVYLGGHFTTMGGAARKKGGAVDAIDGTLTSWNPNFNSALGVFALVTVDGSLWAGGDFTRVGSTRQLRVARFS
jgi:hypothetical protein